MNHSGLVFGPYLAPCKSSSLAKWKAIIDRRGEAVFWASIARCQEVGNLFGNFKQVFRVLLKPFHKWSLSGCLQGSSILTP
jgi:hypothetical protein